jgi:hypothetical protein
LLKFRERIQGIPKEALGKSLLLSLWNNYGVLTREEREFDFGENGSGSLPGKSSILERKEELSPRGVLTKEP